MLNPNLTSLRLDFCGLINDSVLESWSSCLSELKHIDLLGPYLIRPASWINFFKAHTKLESFRILQNPRFDLECIKTLSECCVDLRDLQLKEVGKLNDDFLDYIASLEHLRSLNLSDPANSCSEEALTALVRKIGHRLEEIDLSGHIAITNKFLEDVLPDAGKNFKRLALNNVPELTDEGVANLFTTWHEAGNGPRFDSVSLSRNEELSTDALMALLAQTGSTLTYLDINGWRGVSQEALEDIGAYAHIMRNLDLGWNREVNDVVIKSIIDGCENIKEIKCWGCNRLTANCPRKVGHHLNYDTNNNLTYTFLAWCNYSWH
jgi:DNA repair protein RAD7